MLALLKGSIARSWWLLALSSASVAQAADLASASWADVEAQARQEGQLTWFNWYYQDRLREEVKAFETQYGIHVVIPDGEVAASINKLLAEQSRPQGDIDVLSVGGSQFGQLRAPGLFWGPLDKRLPDGGGLHYNIEGVDTQGYAVAFWGNQTVIAYNAARIRDNELPHTLPQFEQFMQNNPGEFAFNVENGGSGPAFIESITRTLVPQVNYRNGDATPPILQRFAPAWSWFNRYKSHFVISASNADSISRLNAGEFKLAASWEDLVISLQNRGEVSRDVKFYLPDFGMPGGGNVVAIPANARHKAAALLFIHWLTLPETQQRFHQQFGTAPLLPAGSSTADDANGALDRSRSFAWAAKPLGEEIRKQFIQNVMLK
ncbi:extracellular solute-binding protein [Musicola paradisiaca]|uniref:Extracellular solute-binding protein family 1 n=1 Tax=Musicola paradisiaca (strain Ech703) TaxID=579405 RepID=C6C557_MUSP7|nr:extracellular solute-binding protein [Musicola paradisiaca]ACS85667.1 extracellular solute-binding protein family 1 [Musicola paradisiaca Ech703]